MKKFCAPILILAAAGLSACGSNFEWFPKVADTTPPVITATVGNSAFSNNSTTHVSSLPASVSFTSNEAATIYYTTNGSDPTTSSPAVDAGTSPVAGPTITLTNTVLKFFGIDKSSNKNSSTIHSGTIRSP
jgi:hypothetical protein